MAETNIAKEIAQYVAIRLIALRKSKGLRQSDLSPVLGVQGGQISKYEKAESLITLDNLFRAAAFYKVPITDLLPLSLDQGDTINASAPKPGFAEAQATFDRPDASPTAQSNELATAFLTIKNPQIRNALLAHAKALASAGT